MTRLSDSVSSRSPSAVEPVTSAKMTVTTLRAPCRSWPAMSGAPQLRQKRAWPGFSSPQFVQVTQSSKRFDDLCRRRVSNAPPLIVEQRSLCRQETGRPDRGTLWGAHRTRPGKAGRMVGSGGLAWRHPRRLGERGAPMRTESSVTSLSWIPREAVEGLPRLPWDVGIAHYDPPPPDIIDDPGALVAADAARFANQLRAWIEVENGDGWVRFVQTAGGRPGMPAPRRIRDRPFVRIVGPTVWSTLALTIRADGSSDFELVGASSFPRHWIYDRAGRLVAKTGLIDFRIWYAQATPEHSPWGDEESPAIVTAVESSLERELSLLIVGSGPRFVRLQPGETLVEQGAAGDEVFLLFDGVLAVEQDAEKIAEVGPGAVLGEMGVLEGGRRTATLRAVTSCRVAVVPSDLMDRQALEELARGRKPSP